jgi:SAM-dependent methyltransferase
VRSDHGGAPGRRREFLRGTFESAADAYDGARPPYPDELFDDLAELANLKPGARLLEIGCATGKATRPLAERGYSVVCVELGAELAARAREDLVGLPVEIEVSPFEAWEGEPGEFDLVYAATAWHWLDPETRYEKAHRLLRSRRSVRPPAVAPDSSAPEVRGRVNEADRRAPTRREAPAGRKDAPSVATGVSRRRREAGRGGVSARR